MPQAKAKPQAQRAGYGPHCALHTHPGKWGRTTYTVAWKGRAAETIDGALRHFTSESYARAWLAAADATNGATIRPV